MGLGSIPFARRAASDIRARDADLVLTELNDETLAVRAKRDSAAFGALYDRYLDRIYRYIRHRTVASDAEDLTSDVFFRALRAIPRYEPSAPFYAWIYRIARNVVVDHHRAKRDAAPLTEAGEGAGGDGDPERHAIGVDRHDRLVRALAYLSDEQQEVIVLRFIEGLSCEETGLAMGKRPAAVRDLQYRALRALRSHVSAQELTV